MCGRFSLTGDLDFYVEYFGVDEVLTEPLEPNWNVAPTDRVYVISEREGARRLESMRWGLVPHWAKDKKSIHINARLERVSTAPMFRDSFSRKRCLIPADGFYEWEPPERGRTPHWVYRADGHPMVFTGIWASRLDPQSQDWDRTCCILTTEADGVISPIHDRMPLSLQPQVWDGWLDRALDDPETVLGLATNTTDPDDFMEHTVSRAVNNVRNNGPAIREMAAPPTLF